MGAIYLRQGDEFVAMHEQPYEAEAVLQALLAEHPEVLVDRARPGEGRGWLLVKREVGVADAEDAGDRWSLDHLFLDGDGVPTLVEVKRSSDTRARREVVAQMLDYAANATAFWKVDSLRAWFEAECEGRSVDPEAALEAASASLTQTGIGTESERISRQTRSGSCSSPTRSLQNCEASSSS